MKKVAAILLLAFAAAFLLAGCSKTSPAIGSYVFDNGDFLTPEQEEKIQSHILEMRDKVQSDFVVYFTDSPASDDYRKEAERVNEAFIQSGGGYGDDQQSVVFYVDMLNRFFFVDEYNKQLEQGGSGKLSDSDIDNIIGIYPDGSTIPGSVREYMANGNYYGASMQFVDDAYNAVKPGFFGTIWGWLTSAFAGGGAISGILIGKHKRQPATEKSHYRKESGRVPVRSSDRFLGTTREVHHIERQEAPAGNAGNDRPSSNETIHSSSGSSGHHGGGASF